METQENTPNVIKVQQDAVTFSMGMLISCAMAELLENKVEVPPVQEQQVLDTAFSFYRHEA